MSVLSKAFGLLAFAVFSTAASNVQSSVTSTGFVTYVTGTAAAPESNTVRLHRRDDPDPACPDGWLCDPEESCPAGVVQCASDEICLTFRNPEPVYRCASSSLRWCAWNPTLGLIAGHVSRSTVCCHGDNYPAGTECCTWPGAQCSLSGDFCGACSSGSSCGADSCISDSTATITSTPTPTAPTATSTSEPTPSIVQSSGNYTYVGCYVDSADNRILDGESIVDGSDTGITVDECVEFAVANGWRYAGVEFGSECYVGNQLNNDDQMVDGDCSQVCAGDASQFCGEGGRIQIYENQNLHLPTSFAAFGDSYSAGIGAGLFIRQSADGRDNACARMDGSYPYQLWKMGPFEEVFAWQDFYACSGDVLDNIDSQVAALQGREVDFATLSISGNDFGFAKVVKKCVYPSKTVNTDYQAECDKVLDAAAQAINDDNTWIKYREKANLILQDVLKQDTGLLLITGYAKFFATPKSGDYCDSIYFLDSWIYGNALLMTAANRASMNSLVDLVNSKIQSEVVGKVGGSANVVYIDIDKNFNGHRFCEPGNDNDPAGRNDNAHKVWFNDLWTQLDEQGKWTPASNNVEAAEWQEWASTLPSNVTDDPNSDFGGRGVFDDFQRSSCFHPKKDANRLIAAEINLFIYRWY